MPLAIFPNISTTCVHDVDCSPYLTNRMCVAGANWLKTGEPECQCSHFYGFVQSEPDGVVCDKYSSGSYLSMLFYGVFIVYNLVQFLICIIYLVASFKVSRQTRQQQAVKNKMITKAAGLNKRLSCMTSLTAVQTTAVFMMCSMLFGAASATFTLLNFAVISGTPPDFANSGKDGFGRYEFWTRTFTLVLFGVFGGFGTMNICLAWIEAANDVDNFTLNKKKRSGPRRAVLTLEGGIVVSGVAVVTLETNTGIKLIPVLTIVFHLAAIVLNAVAARKIISSLGANVSSTSKVAAKILAVAQSIRDTSRFVMFCSLVATLLSVLFSYFTVQVEYQQPGATFNIARFCHHTIFVALNLNNYGILMYLYPRLDKSYTGHMHGKCFFLWCVRRSEPVASSTLKCISDTKSAVKDVGGLFATSVLHSRAPPPLVSPELISTNISQNVNVLN